MSQQGYHCSEGEKQNQADVDVSMADELSPGLEPKNLLEAGDSTKQSRGDQVAVAVRILPGSETSSIEGCEQGPCPCTSPDCKDGGGGGFLGYGIAGEL